MTCKGQLVSEHIFLEISSPKKQRRIVQTTKIKVYFCFGQLTNRRPTLRLSDLSKGQLNSEWIYEVIVSPKMPTKNYQNFCPGSLLVGT